MIDPGVEHAVATRLAAKDLEGAATDALRGYGPQILGYLRATLPSAAADDAFSVFCEFFWTGLPGFRAESSILTWSYTLAWGAARRILEDPQRWRAQRLSTDAMNEIVQEVRSTTAHHLRKETSDQLARIRSKLDFDEQTLLVLRVDRDLEWNDVAEIMGVDGAVLRKRFERLKTKIRELAVES
jgi:RNA polymerase sigma-70 factor (ECF subfamily)